MGNTGWSISKICRSKGYCEFGIKWSTRYKFLSIVLFGCIIIRWDGEDN